MESRYHKEEGGHVE
jgi:hypothetical protein